MFKLILSLGAQALGVWDQKLKTKYLDRFLELKQEYYEAVNKSDKEWDDAVIDNLRYKLLNLLEAADSQIRKQNTENK